MYNMFITENKFKSKLFITESKFKRTKHKVFTSKHPACYILLVSEWWYYYEGLFYYTAPTRVYYYNTWVAANQVTANWESVK